MLNLTFEKEAHPAVELTRPRITVGRERQNDVVLTHDGISGYHAELHVEEDKLFVVDLGSTNGTFVNGRKIAGRVAVKAWDKVRFDSVAAEVVDTERRRPTQVSRAITDADLGGATSADGKTRVRPAVGGWSLKGTAGPLAGQVIPLAGKQVVGRDSGCDLVIADTMISTRHASLQTAAGGVTLTDLGSTNGTFVNDRKITEALLKAGDTVRFDRIAFQVQGPDGGGAKTAVRAAVGAGGTRVAQAVSAGLVGTGGALAGRAFPLSGQRITVGRTPDNAIALDDDTVSSSHAQITLAGGAWTVEDLSSTNGTFVNDRKVTRQALKSGDRVRFGQVALRFDAPDGGRAAGTRAMPSVDPHQATRTSVTPAVKKGLPAWAYGLIGFAAVGVILGALFALGVLGGGGSGPAMVDAKLQGGRLWVVETGRKGPSTPVLADINGDNYPDVVVVDGDGIVLALDGAEGKRIFEADTVGRVLAPPVAGDLTGDGVPDIVIAGSGGVVTALNGKGQTLWRSAGDLNLGEILNRPVLARVNDDAIVDVVVPTAGRGLVALDGTRGWMIWNTAEMTRGKVITAPLAADINGDGIVDFVSVTDSGQVLAVTSREGKVWQLWETRVPNIFYASPLLIRSGRQSLVVVATDGGGVVALNGENGRTVWSANIEKRFFASPVGADANGDGVADVVLTALNGDIHVLDGLTGDEIWSAALGVQMQASPALWDLTDDGLPDLILLDGAGNLRVLDMARGREILGIALSPGSGFIASPVLGDINNDRLLNIVAANVNGQISAVTLNRPAPRGRNPWPMFLGNDTHGL